MKNQTLVLLSTILAVVVVLFHLSAKRQPSPDETGLFDSMSRPLKWQGKPATDFTLDLLNGEKFTLAEQVGKKVIILNFFATWCGPCKEEMPEFVRYFEQHKDEPFLLIGIDANEPESVVRDFVRDFGVPYPVSIDKGGNLQRLFSVRAFPTTVFIGADGIVHVYEVGQISNADIAFDELLKAHIGMIKAGAGITKEAFLAKSAEQKGRPPSEPPLEKSDPEEPALAGRPRTIADKMHCPCGCDHTLTECACKTAKVIREQLRKRDYSAMTDEEVIKSLNREFCMK